MDTIVKNANKNSLGNIIPQAEEVLEDAKAKGNEYWDMAKEKGKSLWNDTESTRRKAWGQAKGFIQKHPGQAVGYAVLLGVIVGALFYPKGRE